MNTGPVPIVTHSEDQPIEGWLNPDGSHLTWRTLISADRHGKTPLCSGIATLPPSEQALKRHKHAIDELYFVLSGEGELDIDESTVSLRPGTSVLVPGNAWHAIRNPGPQPISLFYVFPTASFTDVVYVYPEGAEPPTWDEQPGVDRP